MSKTPFNPTGVWQGYIVGTNIGVLYARFYNREDDLRVNVFFADHQFGPTTVCARRKASDSTGIFTLSQFCSVAPFVPSGGQLSLVFGQNFLTAEGTWLTDLGTSGTCKLSYTGMSPIALYLATLPIRIKWFFGRWIPFVYISFLLAIAIASLFDCVSLTTLNLILLLLPTPILFSPQLAKLIATLRDAKVKKLGPLELDQPAPSQAIVAAAVTPGSQFAEAFKVLNKFFVPRTKVILSAIAQKGEVGHAEFGQLAASFGTPIENIPPTLEALVKTGCVNEGAGKIVLTTLGREYISKGITFGNG